MQWYTTSCESYLLSDSLQFIPAQYWLACVVITCLILIFQGHFCSTLKKLQLTDIGLGGSEKSRGGGFAPSSLLSSQIKITVISPEAGLSLHSVKETVIWLVMTQPESHYIFDGRLKQKSISVCLRWGSLRRKGLERAICCESVVIRCTLHIYRWKFPLKVTIGLSSWVCFQISHTGGRQKCLFWTFVDLIVTFFCRRNVLTIQAGKTSMTTVFLL